ncbi:serine/threonine protein kinase Nrc-2 [Aspergillus luchuensis]|uniref:Serine/threonine protein kinase Nrc-2 n=1 Tax=Aspergillus kawachii TaxID=1069201 RepID=A0A146FMS7_ASPKA|nr:serine/threonine protein kinase Nrc-2 [Aspergillus luchuensis]
MNYEVVSKINENAENISANKPAVGTLLGQAAAQVIAHGTFANGKFNELAAILEISEEAIEREISENNVVSLIRNVGFA